MPKVRDIAWNHCKKVEGNHNAVTCNYCNRTFMGGGITRFKRHLAGGDPNVEICTKQGNEVRLQFRALVDKSKERKNAKAIADNECQDLLLHVDDSNEDLNEDEDEEIVDIRLATQESLAQQWEKDQHRRLSRSKNTIVGFTREPRFASGSRKNKQSKINSIFNFRGRNSSRNTIDLDKSHNGPTCTYIQDAKVMTTTPADVKEYPNSYHFVVDVPGLKSSDIKVQVEDDNVLVISGERKREEEKEGVQYLRMERRVGKFTRKFALPENANIDKISAVCQDGMLHVAVEKIPPPEPKMPRTIEVKIAQI